MIHWEIDDSGKNAAGWVQINRHGDQEWWTAYPGADAAVIPLDRIREDRTVLDRAEESLLGSVYLRYSELTDGTDEPDWNALEAGR